MIKIGLISDSHGFIEQKVIDRLQEVDEIWHAGDIGDLRVLENLPYNKVKRIVTGNIDDHIARQAYPEEIWFELEGLQIGIIHIAGKPPRYTKGIKEKIKKNKTELLVCGHSHICKVEFDKSLNCLYMNPGAIGQQGFHIMRTMLLFEIHNAKVQNLRVVELGKRGH